MSKMAKKLTNKLHGRMRFLQNRKVCEKETLPITYHNFCHKSRPKRKLTRISTHKLPGQLFTQRDKMHLADHKKKKKLTKISWRKLRSDPYFYPKRPKIINIHLTTYIGDFLTEL